MHTKEKWPRIIIGHCCGCRSPGDWVLYRIGQYRYRCVKCYFKETGYLP